MHNKHREKYLYAFRWMRHLKEQNAPPAKKGKRPSTPGDTTAPEPPVFVPSDHYERDSQTPGDTTAPPEPTDDTYVLPGPHHLWGQPNVPQATRVKLLRPVRPPLGRVILPGLRYPAPMVVPPWQGTTAHRPVQVS